MAAYRDELVYVYYQQIDPVVRWIAWLDGMGRLVVWSERAVVDSTNKKRKQQVAEPGFMQCVYGVCMWCVYAVCVYVICVYVVCVYAVCVCSMCVCSVHVCSVYKLCALVLACERRQYIRTGTVTYN